MNGSRIARTAFETDSKAAAMIDLPAKVSCSPGLTANRILVETEPAVRLLALDIGTTPKKSRNHFRYQRW